MPTARTLCPAVVVVCTLAAIPAAAQAPPAAFAVDLEVSNSEIRRNAALMTAAGQVANQAADIGLDRLFGRAEGQTPKQALWRLGRLWLVSLPIAALSEGMSHNVGHFARSHEYGVGIRSMVITRWPWPFPVMGSVEYPDDTYISPAGALASVGGGEQAAHIQENLIADQIYSRDRSDYFDWALLAYAQLEHPAYAWTDLTSSRIRALTPDTVFEFVTGDFSGYARLMAFIEAGGVDDPDRIRKHANHLRRVAWLNLADYSLWSAVARVAGYVVTGERESSNPVLRLCKLRIVPGFYSTLSSLGPEKGTNLRVITGRYLAHFTVRWIDAPAGDRFWGSGLSLRSRTSSRFAPEFQADVWQRPDGGPGMRVEAGGRGALRIARHAVDASFLIGYKSEGYLVDAPQKAGVLGSLGVAVKF
jgi:hypothetical protein